MRLVEELRLSYVSIAKDLLLLKNIKSEYDTIQCRNRENINNSKRKEK